ncbi:MAG: DNRLRE domain-containing protein [bacterium]|nr:MAG: DNRLRE domain-containing protein [bacterium]
MKHLTWLVSIVVLFLIFFNCGKERPLPTGYSYLFGDKEGLLADTLIVQQCGIETFYSRLINTGSSANLLLGKYQNYHSTIYLKFDNLPDSVRIHSAKLYLTKSPIDSMLLDSSQTFEVDIYLAEYEWENDQDPEQYLDQLPFVNQPDINVTITPDTLEKIEIELDTTMVSKWADTTSGLTNYGIWIDSPDAEGINSFYSTENTDLSLKPQLNLIYTFTDTTGEDRDTTTVYAEKGAFLFRNTEEVLDNLDTTYFYIGKGLAFRSFIEFDLSSFDTTVHLNRALIKIVINKDNSILNASGASDVIIYRKEEESKRKNEVNENPTTSSYAGTLIADTLTFDVTPTVQGWIGDKYPNYGFLIRSFDEEQTLARVAFYSSKTDPELQPRLYLYYTLPPKQEF